jgi:hypothetical protein
MKRTYSLAGITLFTSLFIYMFYRTEKTVINELVLMFFSPGAFSHARSMIVKAIPLNDPVIYSLPGGLWVFCTTVLSKDLHIKIDSHLIPMAAAPILFAVGLEVLQLTGLTKGTFDFWDVAFSMAFWLGAYFGYQFNGARQTILSTFARQGFIWLASFLAVFLAHVNA